MEESFCLRTEFILEDLCFWPLECDDDDEDGDTLPSSELIEFLSCISFFMATSLVINVFPVASATGESLDEFTVAALGVVLFWWHLVWWYFSPTEFLYFLLQFSSGHSINTDAELE